MRSPYFDNLVAWKTAIATELAFHLNAEFTPIQFVWEASMGTRGGWRLAR
jgi:hypothetical protein